MAARIRSRKVVLDGYTFDSAWEAYRYGKLSAMQERGVIADLRVHPSWEFRYKGLKVRYSADFSYLRLGKLIVEDVKSPATVADSYAKLRMKLVREQHGLDVRWVDKYGRAIRPRRRKKK